ncbi:hypothetical protein E2562_007331 [Oryza meyeriana var. granulata]|uniref:Uncharacterized protein n=1 Tax=Oryza meyeriana var. granulata TaxID=110450 RepID=A0A6G1D044_9ORYZ|nr:hypothetical protein E2562_007331 [Oryza meyeriana var. granulata]
MQGRYMLNGFGGGAHHGGRLGGGGTVARRRVGRGEAAVVGFQVGEGLSSVARPQRWVLLGEWDFLHVLKEGPSSQLVENPVANFF